MIILISGCDHNKVITEVHQVDFHQSMPELQVILEKTEIPDA